MTERLMAKLDRLGAEAGIKQMTPELCKFSMLVRADVVAQWDSTLTKKEVLEKLEKNNDRD